MDQPFYGTHGTHVDGEENVVAEFGLMTKRSYSEYSAKSYMRRHQRVDRVDSLQIMIGKYRYSKTTIGLQKRSPIVIVLPSSADCCWLRLSHSLVAFEVDNPGDAKFILKGGE